MPNENAAEPAQDQPKQQQNPTPGNTAPTPDSPRSEEIDWKAEARKWETRAKENSAARDKLAELEQASLSELEKAQKAAQEAQKQIPELERMVRVQRVAIQKALPANLVDRLNGSTDEEIAADADSLLEAMNMPRTPAPDMSQGGHGQGNQSSGDWLRDRFSHT